MTKNNFEQLNDLNVEFFESARSSLLDPLGFYLANDVKWIKLNQNWNSLKFPVVIGGKGKPILLLHGFDSSFLEFRRIYKSCLLYTSPSPRDTRRSRMPSSA